MSPLPGRTKERVFLGLGGNLAHPASSMAAALRILDADPNASVVAVSSLYRTPPWGKTDQPDFINAAAEIRYQPRTARPAGRRCASTPNMS